MAVLLLLLLLSAPLLSAAVLPPRSLLPPSHLPLYDALLQHTTPPHTTTQHSNNPTCTTDIPPANRVHCGQWWEYVLHPDLCTQRGCCWQPSDDSLAWCHYPKPSPPVSTVHVLQGCHLDVGFKSTAVDIVNLWFTKYFPLAASVGANLSTNADGVRLNFTAQSWLVSLYVDCPSTWPGLVCPTPAELATFKAAVAAGYITWHAFPFNSEPEAYDAALFGAGVDLTHAVDAALGVPPKTLLTQRDVPGMTRSVIPLLTAKGVHSVSVGVNGGSTPPNVPPVFLWRDAATNTSVRVLYDQGGYGGISVLNRFGIYVMTHIPGTVEAVVVAWRGDNAGPPPTPQGAIATFEGIQSEAAVVFPNATVVPGTFETVAKILDGAPEAAFPVVTSEIGDTWVHGVGSAPRKLARMRHAQTLRSHCLATGECSATDGRFANFTRFLLKNGEHTWGGDLKTFMPSGKDALWSNADLQAQLANSSSGFQALADTWVAQSKLGLDDAVGSLGDHPLAANITSAWSNLTRTIPDVSHCTAVPAAGPHTLGPLTVGFSPVDGGVTLLANAAAGAVWANASVDGSNLFGLQAVSYSQANFSKFIEDYNYLGVFALIFNDDLYDFDKVGIDKAGANYTVTHPHLLNVYSCSDALHAHVGFPTPVSSVAEAWVTMRAAADGSPAASVNLVNKTATRLPEAMFLSMKPLHASVGPSMRKLGGTVDPSDVVRGGAKHMHLVESVTAGGRTVASTEAGLFVWGEPTAFPIPADATPDFSMGGNFLLFDNIWDTNYIMWITDDDIAFPFNFTLS